MTSRFPLLLAAALFAVGLAGLFGTMAARTSTSPYTPVPGPSAEASPGRALFNLPPALPPILLGDAGHEPSVPAETQTAEPASNATARATSSPVAAASPTPSPTAEPRVPVVVAAVASDDPHMLTPTPAGGPLHFGFISRDEDGDEPAEEAAAEATATPADTATAEATAAR